MRRTAFVHALMMIAGCGGSRASSTDVHALPGPPSIVVGARCAIESDNACSSDGAALLRCKSGTMVERSRCRGAKGCVVIAGTPTCDRTVAEVGDACDAESETACTPKGDAVVQCRGKTMIQTTVCNCRVSASGTTVRCVD